MNDALVKMLADSKFDVFGWLSEQTEESVLTRMYERVPADVDFSVGSYLWDAIDPTAIEFNVAYFVLLCCIKQSFPQLSHGEALRMHARSRGVDPLEATAATGTLLITGAPGITVTAGSKFATTIPSGSTLSPKYYTVTTSTLIGADGTAFVPIQADEAGNIGNVLAGEINLNIQSIAGITSVTNPEAIMSGVDAEEDEALLSRTLERVRNPPSSGNQSDYKRWAKEVAGVSDAIVTPRWNGPGTVKVSIAGIAGHPVTADKVAEVQNYIDPYPHGEGLGKAPIGATVTVTTVERISISISIPDIILDDGYTLDEQLRASILDALQDYVSAVPAGGTIRVKEAEAALNAVPGVLDFGDLRLNGDSRNMTISTEQKAAVGEVEYV